MGIPQMRAPPTGQRAKQTVAAKSLDPGFRLRRPRDDIKSKRPPRRYAPLLTSSRPARPFFLTSSRTARRAEPGSRQTPRKILWIPAFAGMTAKRMWRSIVPRASSWPVRNAQPACPPGRCPFFITSSRTARSAEPGSRQTPRMILWIPASAGMTAKRMWCTYAPWGVIVAGTQRPAGTSSRTAPPFFF